MQFGHACSITDYSGNGIIILPGETSHNIQPFDKNREREKFKGTVEVNSLSEKIKGTVEVNSLSEKIKGPVKKNG